MLKGTLSDFPLPSILQLVAEHAKSGTLHLTHGDREVSFQLDNGQIISARSGRQTLGEALVQCGVINGEILSRALAEQKSSNLRLGELLLSRGWVREDDLRKVLTMQIEDALFGALQWKAGQYEFEAEDAPPEEEILVQPTNALFLLMDAVRMLDEWPAVRSKISGLGGTPELVDPTAIGGIAGLTDPQVRVMQLVDGDRTIRDIGYLSRLGPFQAAKVVGELVDLSLLVVEPARLPSAEGAPSTFTAEVRSRRETSDPGPKTLDVPGNSSPEQVSRMFVVVAVGAVLILASFAFWIILLVTKA